MCEITCNNFLYYNEKIFISFTFILLVRHETARFRWYLIIESSKIKKSFFLNKTITNKGNKYLLTKKEISFVNSSPILFYILHHVPHEPHAHPPLASPQRQTCLPYFLQQTSITPHFCVTVSWISTVIIPI